MKEYDIFLKQRLTEGKIIVYSLPFRDGVSAVNRIVLQALVSYFTMQKKTICWLRFMKRLKIKSVWMQALYSQQDTKMN